MKTVTISIRVDPNIKREAALLFKSLGLSMSKAINIFLNQSTIENAIPFKIKRLNVENLETSQRNKEERA